MIRKLSIIALMSSAMFAMHPALADEDELVRLPGQGELRDDKRRKGDKPDRLKPGSGLFISFDSDENGRINTAEIERGIPAAFETADANADGYLTALEQQDWAASLPTRDDSLANPFRFDPNLDRRVDIDEFTKVISDLGVEYADELSGEIIVANLKAPTLRDERRNRFGEPDESTVSRESNRRPEQRTRSFRSF